MLNRKKTIDTVYYVATPQLITGHETETSVITNGTVLTTYATSFSTFVGLDVFLVTYPSDSIKVHCPYKNTESCLLLNAIPASSGTNLSYTFLEFPLPSKMKKGA